MTNTPTTGRDGPYPAPVNVQKRRVLPEWIDYNGHMNVGYYGIAFDQASDVLLQDYLGVGEEYVKQSGQGPYILQSHTHFLREMKLDEEFSVLFRVLDHDSKRVHFFGEMISDRDGVLCATQEVMMMNVDHDTGRSAEYPDWAVRRFARMKADHAGLDVPAQVGAPLGLRRKG